MLEKIERQKAEALRLIEGWSEARLAYRPAADAWSTSDVFDHIVKTERGILAAPGMDCELRIESGFGIGLDFSFSTVCSNPSAR